MCVSTHLNERRGGKDHDVRAAGVVRCGQRAKFGTLAEPLVHRERVGKEAQVGVGLGADQAGR